MAGGQHERITKKDVKRSKGPKAPKRTSLDVPVLDRFHPVVARWFATSFPEPTAPQRQGWPVIATGASTLLLAPTGSGKTLTGFLWCINRLMFEPPPDTRERCRVLYISPLKALAVDVERNLRAPLAGISRMAREEDLPHHVPEVAIRTGDTPASERARFQRRPADILITTPESLYLLLTSNARDVLRHVHTVIVDEIHAMVATKRGAHLALSLERLEAIATSPIQRIGLSATQRPLDEVARFLGGADGTRRAGAASRPTQRGEPARHSRDRVRSERRTARRAGPTQPTAKTTSTSSSPTPTNRRTGRSRSSMRDASASCRCASRCRSRTWHA